MPRVPQEGDAIKIRQRSESGHPFGIEAYDQECYSEGQRESKGHIKQFMTHVAMIGRPRLQATRASMLHSDWRIVWDATLEACAERYPGVW